MFAKDEKNYHVWSYRQWLVDRFALWADANELRFVERLLHSDVRNNSAWNHRWFVIFGRPPPPTSSSSGAAPSPPPALADPAIVLREAAYAKAAIRLAPQNESPWTYLRGLAARAPALLPLTGLRDFALEFATVPAADPGAVLSSHALDVLAEIYAGDPERRAEACEALDLLACKYDPVRANYWRYRKALVAAGEGVAVAA
jgi:protein farnesyltransferase/geranylgeranyltransferase type-1 subunit alpha